MVLPSHGAKNYQYFLNETLLDETFRGVVLALVLSFLVLTFVSGNIIMAFISVVNITLIVMNVVAFTVLAGYKLGVVEAVLYVVVIGMSIDYSVHSKLDCLYCDHVSRPLSGRVSPMLFCAQKTQ